MANRAERIIVESLINELRAYVISETDEERAKCLSKMAQLLYVGGPDIEQYAIKDTRILSCFLECISTHHELALRLVVKAKIDGIKVIELPLPVGTVNTELSMGEPFNGPGYRAAWRDATVVSSMGNLYIIPTFGKKL